MTPEAVVLDLRTAAIASRGLARFLDLVVELIAIAVILIVPAVVGVGTTTLLVIISFASFLAIFGYPAAWESLWRGRTPGKAALGLRVVTVDGAPIGPRHAIIRAVMGPLDLVAGVESMLISPRDRRLGDVVAGTVVLRDKLSPTATGTAFWFSPPPGWEGYAASLDTRGLTANDQAVIRSFLLRWPEFSPDSRWALAATLAGPLVARLGHQVPPALPPDLYLQSVLAARQRHDHDEQQGRRRPRDVGSLPPVARPAPPGAPPPPGSWGLPAGVTVAPPGGQPAAPASGFVPPA